MPTTLHSINAHNHHSLPASKATHRDIQRKLPRWHPYLFEHAAAEVDDCIDAAELLEHKQYAAHEHTLPVGGTQQAFATT
jgi:hypothetical protein